MPQFHSLVSKPASLVLACIAFFGVQAGAQATKFLGSTYAMDDMSLFDPPSLPNKMGVYFWIPKDEWYFKSTMERVADADAGGNGYVSFLSTHNEKCYHPVGVSFGSDASKRPFYIDMSGEGGDSVTIEVENLYSKVLRVRVTLKDDAENMIDTKAGTPLSSTWMGAMEFDVDPGAIASQTFSYKGGYYAEWGSTSKCNVLQTTPSKLPCGVKKTDMTRIAGANITINSDTPDATGITNADLRVRAMGFGKVPTSGVLRGTRRNLSKYPAGLAAVRMGLIAYPFPDGRVFDVHGRKKVASPSN